MSAPTKQKLDPNISQLTRNTIALILAGGRGSRLMNMTDLASQSRQCPLRQIPDYRFPPVDCMNSGIRKIGVLTQYKADSLIRHIQQGWGFFARRIRRIR